MKKALALLLALLMIFSVVFVSCGEEEEPIDTEDDFFMPSGNRGTGDESSSGKSSGSNSGFNPVVESTTAYLLMSVYVRENYKKASTVNSVDFGQEVTRVETNNTWTKIKYLDDGVAKEGYVRNEVLTTVKGRTEYVALETPISATSKSDSVIVRKVPWRGSENYNTVIDAINNNTDGAKYQLKNGQAVEVLYETKEVDGDGKKWGFIKYTVDGVTDPVCGWCRMDMLNTGAAVDTPVTNPGVPVIPAPIG